MSTSPQEKSFSVKPRHKWKRITININCTQYDIIPKISDHFGWRTRNTDEEDDDSDLIWTDCAVQPEKLCKLKPYQKINHFPGMYELARKNFLAKNLNKMQKIFQNEFDFYPKTWLYPTDFPSLKFGKSNKTTYIVKPEASCQGKGIFLTNSLEGFDENEKYVIQEYIKNPMLIDGLKFDLRIYVLLAGCDPLKIFLYKEGLGRFATENYVKPNSKNLNNQCMHLTNYAINKTSENFVYNSNPQQDDVGHKKSLTATMEKISKLGFDKEKIWNEIIKIIIKTLCAAQPILSHIYRACQPDDPYNGICFELLGFDIILDTIGKPWLLEVNHSPSFSTDSPLDYKIKFSAISEALTLLNINSEARKEYEERKRKQIVFRNFNRNKELEKENKKKDFENAQTRRENWENGHLGNFEKIYPNENPEYKEFLAAASKIWLKSTGGLGNKVPRPHSQERVEKLVKNKISPDIKKKPNLAVFERLSKIKTTKIEENRVPPCVQLDTAFKTSYVRSQSPYSFIELVVPDQVSNKARYKSMPKKRISNYSHHLEEVLKEKRALESIKRAFNVYETPLKISSVVSDDYQISSTEKSNFLKQLVLKRII